MNHRKLFLEAVSKAKELDVANLAMIIAAQFQPGLDMETELNAIDLLAASARKYPVNDAHSLVEFVAAECSFTGNSENYYSATNSLLNQVLATRRGIPITLALVYISLVKRLSSHDYSLTARGINFPGHFLVAITDDTGEHMVDPFKGRIVTKEECYEIIANLYGREHSPQESYFDPADSRQLLRRILENLKVIYLKQGHADNTLVCLDYQLMLYPEAPDLLAQQQDLLEFLRSKGNSGTSRLQ